MATALIYFVIYLIIVGLVCTLLIYLVDAIPLAPPFNRIARLIIIAIGVIIVILLLVQLLPLSGHLLR